MPPDDQSAMMGLMMAIIMPSTIDIHIYYICLYIYIIYIWYIYMIYVNRYYYILVYMYNTYIYTHIGKL